MNKCSYLYFRVSTLAQKTESQEKAVKDYARKEGIEALELHDKATGKTQNRKEFQKLLGEVQAGRVARVICYDISRIGRNLMENLAFAKACLDRKVKLFGVKDNCDIDTPDGRFKFNVISAMSEYQREKIVENTIAGLELRKEKYFKKFGTFDGWQGGTRKGWTSDKVKKILPKVYELIDLGMSVYFVADRLGLNWRTISRYKKMRGQELKSRKQVNAEYRAHFNTDEDLTN